MGKRRDDIDPIERYNDITRANRTERGQDRIYPPRPDEKLRQRERRMFGLVIIVFCLASAGTIWQRTGGISTGWWCLRASRWAGCSCCSFEIALTTSYPARSSEAS